MKYRIIGNMTGNSMDAIDLVLTEFDGDKMNDICTFSMPYSKDMQNKIDDLRAKCFNKTADEIERLPEFLPVHDAYILQVGECINKMCEIYQIDKSSIDAIGFHGKTLDHNPPSKALLDGTQPYTLQIGSGQMLADITSIKVVYDFRSDALMAGFDGAPLVPPHNAHISASEGDGIYYNGGNTSNFAIITNGIAQIGADAGPFNEYTDSYIRAHTDKSFDQDGIYGKKGKLNKSLLQELFNIGRKYYEQPLPKSGDPAYYHRGKIFAYIEHKKYDFNDVVHTFEYFAAYIAAYTLSLVPENIKLEKDIVLFGGGWKNPVVRNSFENILHSKAYVLPEHKKQFEKLLSGFEAEPRVRTSSFGDFMEARLFADLARYKLEDRAWEIPEIVNAGKTVVCGRIAYPKKLTGKYTDCINRAAKGWQNGKGIKNERKNNKFYE